MSKTFIHQRFPFELYKKCERIEGSENTVAGRLYKTPEGKIYPSVTSVLACREKPELEQWRALVGDEEAAQVSLRATTKGTYIHDFAEDYVNNKVDVNYRVNPLVLDRFEPFKRALDTHVNNVFHTELKMYSTMLKVAGTTDLIAEYDNELSIIDYKTSNKIKSKFEIEDYFIQASVYAVMVYEMFGKLINNVVIIMGVDGDKEPLIFQERVKNHLKNYSEIRKEYKAKFAL